MVPLHAMQCAPQETLWLRFQKVFCFAWLINSTVSEAPDSRNFGIPETASND